MGGTVRFNTSETMTNVPHHLIGPKLNDRLKNDTLIIEKNIQMDFQTSPKSFQKKKWESISVRRSLRSLDSDV